MQANYSTDQKNFTGHMFNIKSEKRSYKISLNALLIKIQWSKNGQEGGGTMCPLPPGADRVNQCKMVKCNCYQIVTESLISLLQVEIVICRYQYHTLIKYQEKKNVKLGRYLISSFCGFETFHRLNFAKMVKNRENREMLYL